jgi:hypothetical protein
MRKRLKWRDLFQTKERKGWLFFFVGLFLLVVIFATTGKKLSPWYIIPGIFLLISKFYLQKLK